jgi:hypothetical protein
LEEVPSLKASPLLDAVVSSLGPMLKAIESLEAATLLEVFVMTAAQLLGHHCWRHCHHQTKCHSWMYNYLATQSLEDAQWVIIIVVARISGGIFVGPGAILLGIIRGKRFF